MNSNDNVNSTETTVSTNYCENHPCQDVTCDKPQSEEKYFEWLSDVYQIPPEYLPCTLAKDFDFQNCVFPRDRRNLQTTIPIADNSDEMVVDKKLASLMKIINRDKLVAYGCYDFNYFGFSMIHFSLDGFKHWVDRLHQAAVNKYNTNDSEILADIPIIQRFFWDVCEQKNLHKKLQREENNFLVLTSGLYSGKTSFDVHLTWHFLPSDVDAIVEQLNELDL
jgi:hypothetical protein